MSVPEYSYTVDATGRIRTLVGNDAWQPMGAVLLEGVQKTAAWFGPFQPPERDLPRSIAHGGRYVAVSACGNEVRGRAQAAALARLHNLGVRSKWVKLVHQLRGTRRTRSRMEASQRSRGFLFLAMGAAVARPYAACTPRATETPSKGERG